VTETVECLTCVGGLVRTPTTCQEKPACNAADVLNQGLLPGAWCLCKAGQMLALSSDSTPQGTCRTTCPADG